VVPRWQARAWGCGQMKTCPHCGFDKYISAFSRNKGRADGRAAWCKPCTSAYQVEYNKRPGVAERLAALALARYHAMSPTEKLDYNSLGRRKGWQLKAAFGLSLADYKAMLEAQGGCCAICQRTDNSDRFFAVDHDHACCPTQKTCGQCVRGLLCTPCNAQLGFLENIEWRVKADAYLIAREIERRKK
jgi:hypothetical protein